MPEITLPDARLHYERRGSGPPVVFVQGVGAPARAWSPQIDGLAGDHDCIAIDNRGLGKSEGDVRALDVATMARDAIAVVDALGLGPVHWVGHSLGGVIVQRAALERRDLVRSLAFLCTFAGGRDLRSPPARLVWLGMRSRLGTAAMRRRAFARLVMPDAYLAARGIGPAIDAIERVFGRSLAEPPPISDAQLRALRAHDERERLGELRGVPALVMSGAHDVIARPAAGRAVAEGIGTARYLEYPDASHGLPIQQPEEVNARLREHFAAADRSAGLSVPAHRGA
jgi:pimeloyl-ACP methyl ester carboxylesterase